MLLKQNLALLEKKNPQLAQLVASTELTGRYKMSPSSRPDGLPTIIDTRLNKNFYNSIDPSMMARRDIESRGILLPNLAVFLGFAAGYHLAEYLQKYPQSFVLAIESDMEMLKTVMSNLRLKELFSHPNFSIVGGIAPNQLYPAIFNFFNTGVNLSFLSSLNVIDHPVSMSGNQHYYIASIRTVKDAIAGVLALYGNDPYDSLLGIKFTLRNISTIIDNPGIKELEGTFKGKPGIIVATGPSLNKNVKLLEGLHDKAVIVAVDASVKVLKKHGIKPAHLVTSLERVEATAKLFEGLTPDDVKDSFLAACPVVVPETYANFPGEKIVVYRNFATFKWLDVPKGVLDIGPSSANMAFKILEFLGCDPIIIIGQDLAYGEDDKSHAEGFHYGEEFESAGAASALQVEGNYQPLVKTTPVWYSFLRHYERDMAAHTGTVINATEGGAKIHGTEVMTFAESIEKYIDKDLSILDTIRKNLKNVPKKVKINQVKDVLKKLYHATEFCNKLINDMKMGVDEALGFDKIMEDSEGKPDENATIQLGTIINKHESVQKIFNDKDFYLILMHYVQSYYIKASMDLNSYKFKMKPSLELNILLNSKYKELFSVMAVLVEKLNDEFKISIELLEKYRDELEI